MAEQRSTAPKPRPEPKPGPAQLQRLLPPGGVESPLEVAQSLWPAGGRARAGTRPYVIVNMISSADGRATIGGRAGLLGDAVDRELFHALRTVADAVLVGAGTAREERYGRLIRDPASRQRRREQGKSEEPLACVVSGRMDLPQELPLLATPEARVVIVTNSQASLASPAAHVEYLRAERDGMLDLHAALCELRERYAVELLLCEGGPHLNANLLAAGLVDELLVTLAPKLAGGDPSRGEALRIVAGAMLQTPVELALTGVLQSGSELFLRYAVRA
ncbi:MAG TPA: dihydrofolate reductase family protein [Solirubrobacteraceae bacterium]|jgi:riboflavin-specific deaminase-like protein|nr:dihydrofolate reductase family protein [Solirubrobacteraceae bacterium]